MEKKSLFLNGIEVLRIDKNGEKTLYLVGDDIAMKEADIPTFEKELKNLAYVFITCYDMKKVEEYREFDKFFRDSIDEMFK